MLSDRKESNHRSSANNMEPHQFTTLSVFATALFRLICSEEIFGLNRISYCDSNGLRYFTRSF